MRRAHLLDFEVVPSICPRLIISQRLRAYKFVIARRCCNEVTLPSNLACETRDWASHLVNLAEDDDAGETCMRIVGY